MYTTLCVVKADTAAVGTFNSSERSPTKRFSSIVEKGNSAKHGCEQANISGLVVIFQQLFLLRSIDDPMDKQSMDRFSFILLENGDFLRFKCNNAR